MERTLNTAGPCRPDRDYMLPPLDRLPEAPGLVKLEKYFVVHAPRQTGKTTTIRAMAADLTASGRYAALMFSCERARGMAGDQASTQRVILEELRTRSKMALPQELRPPAWPAGMQIREALTEWALACPRPVVLFIDEIDTLTGPSLTSVLSQLRAGYADRPEAFPASVVLCGMRDVRDYQTASGGGPDRLGTASPFNILVESFRLGDFSRDEIAELYAQHTADTGQRFTDEGVDFAHEITGGQPWLVNALAREVAVKMEVPVDEAIGPRRLEAAKDRLIKARATHLDSLAARLTEPRVQRIIQPLLTAEAEAGADIDTTYNDDLSYSRDLGLVAADAPVRIANPIYSEVIPRVLGARAEDEITADPRDFIRADGTLDFQRLLCEFTVFWRQHGEVLTLRDTYHEAAPHLVLMAYLYKLVNGGGYVDREHAVGSGRTDLLIRWPYNDAHGKRTWQREALELKVWHPGRPDPLAQGLRQLDGYSQRLGLDTGTLVLFDRRPEAAPLPDRTTITRVATPGGRPVTVVRA